MGKEGLRLVLMALNNEGIEKGDAAKAAEYYLENYRFIYQNPDDDKVCFIFPSKIILSDSKFMLLSYFRGTRGHF